MKIVFNGDLVDIEAVPCTPTGWLIGAGIFETIRTVMGVPYAFKRHMVRAHKSSAIANVPLPHSALVELAVNALLVAEPAADGLLRISFDANGQWAAVHLPYHSLTTPARVRIHPDALISNGETIKTYPYEHRMAILEEAKILGFDEAIVTSTEGRVCEGAVSNLAFLIDGRWLTPPTTDGVLPGIMRDLVIENCGIEVASIPISRINDIASGFLLSSLRIAQPIASLNGRELSVSHAFNDEIHAMAVLHSVG